MLPATVNFCQHLAGLLAGVHSNSVRYKLHPDRHTLITLYADGRSPGEDSVSHFRCGGEKLQNDGANKVSVLRFSYETCASHLLPARPLSEAA